MAKETWKKWFSYIIPQTKYVKSEVNGHLEVGWIEGRKVLDSQHANYSYGPLQDVLEYGLKQMSLDKVNTVLVLGMGAGSIIQSLRNKFCYTKSIVAVEFDPIIIQIAEEEFGIVANNQLEIHCEDAENFVENDKRTYDLIIVDVFVDKDVPEEFYGNKFWRNLNLRANPNAQILFNAGVESLDKKFQDSFLNKLPKTFKYNIHTDVLGGNTLILLEK